MKRNKRGILIVVSGFSGAGKGTLMKELITSYDNYALSVSMTTRNPRQGEENGVSYFFVTQEEFEERIEKSGLIEYAKYCENYYGTPKEYVEKQLEAGKDVILEIEIQGALKIKEKFPEALLLFVMPPNVAELKKRLVNRGTETEDVINQRMKRAAQEADGIEKYDYIVINDDLKECTKELDNIIRVARNAPIRNQEFIENIREGLKNSSERGSLCYTHLTQI